MQVQVHVRARVKFVGKKSALERAFEIARSGRYLSVEHIRRQLGQEGYDQRQVMGAALSRQLRGIAREARSAAHCDFGKLKVSRTTRPWRTYMNERAIPDDAEHLTVIYISTPVQFREALSRLRFLERAAEDSSLGRERAALELAISRYLATSERRAG